MTGLHTGIRFVVIVLTQLVLVGVAVLLVMQDSTVWAIATSAIFLWVWWKTR